MITKNSPIGVFDSGVGGLNVTEKLIELFPHESFIYLADTKNCPYGPQTPAQIAGHVTRNVQFLESKGAKAIVIACNTATVHSGHLKDVTKLPVIGVIDITAQYALEQSKTKNFAVLATQATITSNKYPAYLLNHGAENAVGIACPKFVPIVEAGKIGTKEALEVVKEIVEPLKSTKIDTIILGCTHYPLLEKEVREVIGSQVNIISSGVPAAKKLIEVLEMNELISSRKDKGTLEIYATGSAESLKEAIFWFKAPYTKLESTEE